MTSNVSGIYIHVIDDVISKVRDEFISYGVGDGVLSELQALWEAKMMHTGVILGSIENRKRMELPAAANGGRPVHDLNVPYEEPVEEYETPTAEMLFPPTPLQTPMQTPLPGSGDYKVLTGKSNSAPGGEVDMNVGIPIPFMQPPSPWMNQRPLGVDVNVAYIEGREEPDRGASRHSLTQDFFTISTGKRKRDEFGSGLTAGGYIPQQDGSGDVTIEFVLPKANRVVNSSGNGKEIAISAVQSNKEASVAPLLPQLDGINDEYDNLFPYEGVATEDYNTVNTPADNVDLRVATPSVGIPKVAKSEALDDDEPPLNEDDDDDDLDDVERGEEEPLTQHLVLAQFDKVSRTKSRWKCSLKDGIMHINKREMLFNKATGEFDF